MWRLRSFRAADLDSLYALCAQTGDRGEDATALFREPKLLGALYAAPYGVFAPESCFLVEDAGGVAGYAVGVHDTVAFDAWMIAEWLPKWLRDGETLLRGGGADAATLRDMESYTLTPRPIVEGHPAHLHLAVLPRLRRCGAGRALAERWMDNARKCGVSAAHIGVAAANLSGLAFWRAVGFAPIPGLADAEGPENVFCGRAL